MYKTTLIRIFAVQLLLIMLLPAAHAQYAGWQHSGSLAILTTPEGANLPATARETGFPVLIRLNRETFDFSQAQAGGADLRFATSAGETLPYQIEEWNPVTGTASLWVRLPEIRGNSIQEIRMFWGRPDAVSESAGGAVFNAANGYLSVLHLGEGEKGLTDETGKLSPTNSGTTTTNGIIGKARHFEAQKGIQCGEQITGYPTGSAPHSSSAWFRANGLNAIVLGWGNEHSQGKVTMRVASPPQVHMECYFSGADVRTSTPLPMGEWVHAVHTYENGESRIYINGRLDGVAKRTNAPLAIKEPARMWLGGWYNDYHFAGDIDEVRVAGVVRSADWVRLEYENQKPLQTLVGTLAPAGEEFSVTPAIVQMDEGGSVTVTARAGGARKVSWTLLRGGQETVVAVDRYHYTLAAGRVTGDTTCQLRFKAVFAGGVRVLDIPVTIRETIPEPEFTLRAPARWNGRDTIEVVPEIRNLAALKAAGADQLHSEWSVTGGAVIATTNQDRLLLERAQFSGPMTVRATLSNGGAERVASAEILVTEPAQDPWITRVPGMEEQPVDGQFYARDDKNVGTLYYNGKWPDAADSVFLKVYANDQLIQTQTLPRTVANYFALSAPLRPGLIQYRVEFGSVTAGQAKVLRSVTNLVCGDAFLIDGQSNALATDTGEKSSAETNKWIRSYGGRGEDGNDGPQNRWCSPVWKAQNGELVELGYWGMELARRLVASRQIPVFIVNAAVGGTRIDQHQRQSENPTDPATIYGRMLWRIQQAKLTHGIRAVIWHQGENDQGSDGPTGGYGWETYQRYFVAMSADWKRDFPNLGHYYIFQIWPNSCSMGNSHGDMLREVQRTLPRLYSHMDILSTLGVRPPGGCHYPLIGWAEFARMLQPLIERDFHGQVPTAPITAPNLRQARYVGNARDTIALEFDQPVVWQEALVNQFYLDGQEGQVSAGSVAGNVLTLQLKSAATAREITYLHEMKWSQDHLLLGANGIAALSFCAVPLATP